ncbi:MAG: hypothetical protein JRH18_00115 [Deltaproteobacteria bacterium]|nr:hypothetical protein [Deltaproteobacteria bacterium]MBW1996169.1 hypothetical protein [Deltaproteobacteria bacterium]MBW2150051.1 hypothetical protein [Deltaproteobacteria bacterium]
MKKTRRFLDYYLLLPLVTGLIVVAVAAPVNAADCSANDNTGPTVLITSPTSEGFYETAEDIITLSGDVFEDCGLQMIGWSVNEEVEVHIASGQTDDWLQWSWRAEDIPLTEGENHIVVTAEDAAGNLGQAFIDVTYNPPVQPPPPPAPPIPETTPLDPKKAKFTFYFGGSSYEDLDRVSIVSYLRKEADAKFVMPFDQDVTVMIHVQGVDEPIFTQTVPAGTISGTTKYRYTGSPPGIRELTFMKSTSTTVYMYLFVERCNFLPDVRDTLTAEAYQEYIKSIGSFTLTLLIGGDKAWQGSAPLQPGGYNLHKQEMVYNR